MTDGTYKVFRVWQRDKFECNEVSEVREGTHHGWQRSQGCGQPGSLRDYRHRGGGRLFLGAFLPLLVKQGDGFGDL
jgi:hypothetical protein